MRDICADLQERVQLVAQRISLENTRFAGMVSRLQAGHESKLDHLKAQLRLANKLLEFTVWQDKVRADLAARIAITEAAENLIRDHSTQPLIPNGHGAAEPSHAEGEIKLKG
jgi:hypothetical protein